MPVIRSCLRLHPPSWVLRKRQLPPELLAKARRANISFLSVLDWVIRQSTQFGSNEPSLSNWSSQVWCTALCALYWAPAQYEQQLHAHDAMRSCQLQHCFAVCTVIFHRSQFTDPTARKPDDAPEALTWATTLRKNAGWSRRSTRLIFTSLPRYREDLGVGLSFEERLLPFV